MKIDILLSLEGAKIAKGLTVIIDVFRACSTACYVFAAGAAKIIPVADINTAYKLKKQHPDFILMGERDGLIPPGFDHGNSPSEIEKVNLNGKTVAHTTTLGTQGIANAKSADEVLTGSFVNADAVVRYIKSKNPKRVSLVCTGTANEQILDEDLCCARYLKNALLGKPNDFAKIVNHLKTAGFADHFFDPNITSHPEADFELCMSLDKFYFVLKTEGYRRGLSYLRKIEAIEFNYD